MCTLAEAQYGSAVLATSNNRYCNVLVHLITAAATLHTQHQLLYTIRSSSSSSVMSLTLNLYFCCKRLFTLQLLSHRLLLLTP
jgi:hypothetical protein